MNRFYVKIFSQLSMLVLVSITICGIEAKSQPASVACVYYLNNGPIARATAFNEERISSATYAGLAQRYNGLIGQVTGIRFWARGPVSVGAPQTVRVVMYQENVGFPGTIFAQTTASVPSSSTWQQIDAVFTSPVNVNGNVILSIEPSSPSTNDIWVQHNLEGNVSNNYIGNGGNLYLNLIKQGVTWFKDLANGDPSWDYDFMIMPIRNVNITPGFNFNANNLAVNFTNTSTNASGYSWSFGDGGTSTQANPTHSYTVSGTYSVKLVVSGPVGSGCVDSITQNVVVTNTGIQEAADLFSAVNVIADGQLLEVVSTVDGNFSMIAADGKLVRSFQLKKGIRTEVRLVGLSAGIYSLRSNNTRGSIKFFKP